MDINMDQVTSVLEDNATQAENMLNDPAQVDGILVQLEEKLKEVPGVGEPISNLMLMIDIPDEEARAKAARLKEFRKISFQGHEIPVSVSGGLASADCSSVEDLRTLIRMADDNLYHAKENGRDQIFGGQA